MFEQRIRRQTYPPNSSIIGDNVAVYRMEWWDYEESFNFPCPVCDKEKVEPIAKPISSEAFYITGYRCPSCDFRVDFEGYVFFVEKGESVGG